MKRSLVVVVLALMLVLPSLAAATGGEMDFSTERFTSCPASQERRVLCGQKSRWSWRLR